VYVWLGLGTLYGDHDLRDHMDSASITKTVECTLWKHFERFVYVSVAFTILCRINIKIILSMIGYAGHIHLTPPCLTGHKDLQMYFL